MNPNPSISTSFTLAKFPPFNSKLPQIFPPFLPSCFYATSTEKRRGKDSVPVNHSRPLIKNLGKVKSTKTSFLQEKSCEIVKKSEIGPICESKEALDLELRLGYL